PGKPLRAAAPLRAVPAVRHRRGLVVVADRLDPPRVVADVRRAARDDRRPAGRVGVAGAGARLARARGGAEDQVGGAAEALDPGGAAGGPRHARASRGAAHRRGGSGVLRVRAVAPARAGRDLRSRGDARRRRAAGSRIMIPGPRPDLAKLEPFLRKALEEDVGAGDITTEATVPEGLVATGTFL